ncbi:MAG: glutathione S-transferase family protein [Pseudomonadota bacterium]|nr:glutathione S-transferase family protein [Pseudomonadota bacterium]
MTLRLVIVNKAYSSWSLRPWLAMTHFGIPFEETVIAMNRPETRAEILKFSPTGKCPALIDGDTIVWESLAIIEYLAESFPDLAIWPREKRARALARSLANEMHGGFTALRGHCPTQFLRPVRKKALTEAVEADVARIEAAWGDARARFGAGGPFLFGAFSAADAMFAPVVNRFHTYDIDVAAPTRAYMAAIMALPAWKAWIAGAEGEPWRIDYYDQV